MIEVELLLFILVFFGIFCVGLTLFSMIEGVYKLKVALPFYLLFFIMLFWYISYHKSEKFDMIEDEYFSQIYVIDDITTVGHYFKLKGGKLIKLNHNLKNPELNEVVINVTSELPRYGIYNIKKQGVMTHRIINKEYGF